jgi:site-specific recombinase XerD
VTLPEAHRRSGIADADRQDSLWPGVADPVGLLDAVADWLTGYGNRGTRRTYAEGLGLPVSRADVGEWLTTPVATPEWAAALGRYAAALDLVLATTPVPAGRRPPPASRGRLRHLHWFRWCATTGLDPLAVRAWHIKAWLDALATAGAAVSTRDRMLATVKAFYGYLAEQDLIAGNPAALNRKRLGLSTTGHASTTVTLTPAQVAVLLDVAGQRRSGGSRLRALRARAIVALLTLGLRVSELSELDRSDLHGNRGRRALRVPGKGGKPRIVYLSVLADQALTAYLAERDSATDHAARVPARRGEIAAGRVPLVAGGAGGRMSRQTIWQLLRRVAAVAGPDLAGRLHPHALRHFYVTAGVEAGADLADIQADVGHASIDTTRGVYDHAARHPDRSAVDRVAASIEEASAHPIQRVSLRNP